MREIKKRERACFWVIHGERERERRFGEEEG